VTSPLVDGLLPLTPHKILNFHAVLCPVLHDVWYPDETNAFNNEPETWIQYFISRSFPGVYNVPWDCIGLFKGSLGNFAPYTGLRIIISNPLVVSNGKLLAPLSRKSFKEAKFPWKFPSGHNDFWKRHDHISHISVPPIFVHSVFPPKNMLHNPVYSIVIRSLVMAHMTNIIIKIAVQPS